MPLRDVLKLFQRRERRAHELVLTPLQLEGVDEPIYAAEEIAEVFDLLALQVVGTNTAAVQLYQRLGYVAAATNRFWVRNPEPRPNA